ncbi:hypothetical protein LOC67_04180 [Stieleria sp. JC731]|uniref:hypothetical protein n=1 Tax=Roseiconus sp. JC912 TaxID=3396307 RepID=UPI003A4C6809|nr:hypothetical protein [Stieleria sp. JC731]
MTAALLSTTYEMLFAWLSTTDGAVVSDQLSTTKPAVRHVADSGYYNAGLLLPLAASCR